MKYSILKQNQKMFFQSILFGLVGIRTCTEYLLDRGLGLVVAKGTDWTNAKYFTIN